MGSNNKRKMTMAKRDRERGLADRRLEKQARKAARRQAAQEGTPPAEDRDRQPSAAEGSDPLTSDPAVDAAVRAREDIEGRS